MLIYDIYYACAGMDVGCPLPRRPGKDALGAVCRNGDPTLAYVAQGGAWIRSSVEEIQRRLDARGRARRGQ